MWDENQNVQICKSTASNNNCWNFLLCIFEWIKNRGILPQMKHNGDIYEQCI